MSRERSGNVIYPNLDTVSEEAFRRGELHSLSATSDELKNGDLVWHVRVGVLREDELCREDLHTVEGHGSELASACRDAIHELGRLAYL
jgi:hypothetical protein